MLEQKEQFRNELHKQIQEKNIVREQEKELKAIERKHLMMLKEKLDEEEKFGEQEKNMMKTPH